MAFDKDAYWEERSKKKPKGSVVLPGPAEVGFDNSGHVVVKNRAYRRRKIQIEIDTRNKPKKNRKRK